MNAEFKNAYAHWRAQKERAENVAEKRGHKLGPFSRRRSSHGVMTAMCQTCLLKYRCGTKEAAGLL